MPDSLVDPRRRSLLLGGASLASLAATGCCSIPRPEVGGLCLAGTSSYLSGPEAQGAWAGSERYFDAHAHFFNAADVPVAGFLSKSVAHSIEDPKVRELLIALAPIAEFIGKTLAPSPKAEMEMLCREAGGLSAKSLEARSGDLDSAIESHRQKVGGELFDEISRRNTPIPAIVNEAAQAVRSVKANSAVLKHAAFSREFVTDSVSHGAALIGRGSGRIRPMDKGRLDAQEARLAAIQGAFQFVGLMLSPRHHNLRTFIRRFAEGSPSLPLSGCFSAMVDFNYWLDCPGKASSMRDQVLVQEQMALLSQGFMLPLVAYNPWVDIEEGDASLATVEWAVKEHGCVGVKIYPPMGFYPYGNPGNPILGSGEPRPDLQKLDEKLARFFAKCEELDVPVMAHANESNGRDGPHDRLAGVKGWRLLDEGLPTLKSLYVNAGHFGGALDHEDANWTSDFAALMDSAKRLRVYADLGYWDELLTSDAARKRLAKVLTLPVGQAARVADRAMYGSDWLMLSKEPGWGAYADGIARVVRSFDASGQLARKVLGGNVLQCYGLDQGSGRQNLQRLKAYYASPGRSLPGWM